MRKNVLAVSRVLVVTEPFNIVEQWQCGLLNTKLFAWCGRMLVVTELVVSENQCTLKQI